MESQRVEYRCRVKLHCLHGQTLNKEYWRDKRMRTVGIFYAFWTQDWNVDFTPYIKKVRGLGFDQLELNAGIVADMSSQERAEMKQLAEDEGVILSYGLGLPKPFDISSLDESVRENGITFMKQVIRALGEMGGGIISGSIHSAWPSALPEGMEDKKPIWDQSVKSMKELSPLAHDHGVSLNIEVINRFETFLINDSREALAFMQEVDHPACRITLDTFHMNIEEDSFEEAIHRVSPYLTAMHIGETNRKAPGTGRIPWGEVRKALDDIGFDGPIVMEPFVMKGGQVGRNIAVWRDMEENPDLDAIAADSASFVRKTLC